MPSRLSARLKALEAQIAPQRCVFVFFGAKGDLLLGVITDGDFSIIANGIDIPIEGFGDNRVINLGSTLGPNIDLTIEGDGVFALGGAVPEPSTKALMLLGFVGLGFVGYRTKSRVNVRVV